jgi:hypothetical protein
MGSGKPEETGSLDQPQLSQGNWAQSSCLLAYQPTVKWDEEPTEKSHIHSLGSGRAQDGHGGDDPQGALGPNEQLLQVIARVVLPQGGQAVQDGAVGKHLSGRQIEAFLQ